MVLGGERLRAKDRSEDHLGGCAASAPRVVATEVVRDRHSGQVSEAELTERPDGLDVRCEIRN